MSENVESPAPAASPAVPWKLRIVISLLSAVTDFSRKSNDTVNRRLMGLFNVTAKAHTEPVKGVKASDITVDPARKLWFRLFTPTDVSAADSLPVIVFFHGGGFSFLSADTTAYDAVCRRFSRETPAVVVSVNYRLSPEHRYPSPYDDGFDTLKFLDQGKCPDFPKNADLSRCFLVGDSAGGNIAHFVARRFAETESEFRCLKVIGLVPIQAYLGGQERTDSEIRLTGVPLVSVERTDWHWKAFLPEGSDRDHEACNVFGPNSSDISGLSNFPVTMIVIGGFDPLQDWQRRYYEGLKRSGQEARLLEYPNAIHAFYIFPELPETSLFFTEAMDFIRKHSQQRQG